MKQLYFPDCDSREHYLKRQTNGDQFFYNISPEMSEAIDEIAPYRGGNDALWKLATTTISTSTKCWSPPLEWGPPSIWGWER
ncbi:hypothetical protein [Variovorax rhizosphaerae]|uniref:Uncharacterized protein n=1 Tax=Variovorax rhizosphaerae TaxID=1836200 RepID=A0ABU8X0T7_9BURK